MSRGQEIKQAKETKLLRDLVRYSYNNYILELLLNHKPTSKIEEAKHKLQLMKLVRDNSKSFFCVKT